MSFSLINSSTLSNVSERVLPPEITYISLSDVIFSAIRFFVYSEKASPTATIILSTFLFLTKASMLLTRRHLPFISRNCLGTSAPIRVPLPAAITIKYLFLSITSVCPAKLEKTVCISQKNIRGF